MRRWSLALLGAALTIVVAGAPAGASISGAQRDAHAVAAAGHLTEALLVVAHPRAAGQLPAAVATHPVALPAGPARWAVSPTVRIVRATAVTPPAAIRGPPA